MNKLFRALKACIDLFTGTVPWGFHLRFLHYRIADNLFTNLQLFWKKFPSKILTAWTNSLRNTPRKTTHFLGPLTRELFIIWELPLESYHTPHNLGQWTGQLLFILENYLFYLVLSWTIPWRVSFLVFIKQLLLDYTYLGRISHYVE